MANYSLILNAPFKPFSYQEMVAPVLAATQAHQAVEEDYANLTAAANTVAGKANEQTDPYAYKMYKTYADDLANRADQLLRYGLNATSRRDMLNMRARYGNEIAPIDAAYKRREALADEQRKMSAQNPTMLYEREAKYMSLDDFIKNPSLDYGNQYSGALLAQQVGQAAANIAKEARDSEEGRRKLRRILPYQYELVQQHGFSREAVMNAILNSPDADKILTGLVDSAITTSGVGHLDEYGNPTADGWGDLKTRRRAYDYARQGLWNAIGQTQYQMVADEYGMRSASQAQTARLKKEADEAAQRASNRLNPSAIRDQNAVDERVSKLKKYIDSGYITKTNTGYYFTNKGKRAYLDALYRSRKKNEAFKKQKDHTYDAYSVSDDPKVRGDYAFMSFMDDLLAGETAFVMEGNQAVTTKKGNTAINKSIKALNDEGAYDIYHSTEYIRQLSGDYGKEVLTQVLANAAKEGLDVVHFDSKNREWKTDETIKVSGLKNPVLADIRYSHYGITGTLITKGENGKIDKVYKIKIPTKNINNTIHNNIQSSIANADDFGAILAKGLKPQTYYDVNGNMRYKKDRSGNIVYTSVPLTQADIKDLENKQDRELENMGMFGSQLVVPSKTKDEEYEVINF